jgi:hypothetical protein
MGLKVTNNAFGTLNAGITNSDTTLVLQSGQGSRFPSLSSGDYFYATLIDTSNNLEIVKVTARSTDTMTIVRAQDNTTARAYSTNDRFELRPTAAMLNEVIAKGDAAVQRTGDTLSGNLILPNLGIDTDSDSQTIRMSANSAQSSAGVSIIQWGKDMSTWGGDIHYLTDSRGVGGNHVFWKWDGTNFVQLVTVSKNGGIKFPASQNASSDANTLDDYEEGTWTPTINLLGTLTYGNRWGKYQKIGKYVRVSLSFSVSSTDTTQDGSPMQITGLPFTSASIAGSNYENGAFLLATEAMRGTQAPTSQNNFFGLVDSNATTVSVVQNNYNATISGKSWYGGNRRDGYTGGTMYLLCQFTYETNA